MGTKSKTYEIEIQFCTQCGWLPRASWMMQEILTTFQDEILSVTLTPKKKSILDRTSEDSWILRILKN
jgi:predicted Rdx family selenoprotein